MSELFKPESEEALLSILVRNPEKLYEVGTLKSEFFTSFQTRATFNALSQMISEGLVPDRGLLLDRLVRTNELDAVGTGFIDKLINSEHSSVNFKEYAKNVVDSFIAKNLMGMGPQIHEWLNHNQDVYSVVGKVSENLSALMSHGLVNATKTVGEWGQTYIEEFKERVKNPGNRFHTTGFPRINALTGGIAPGDLWIIAARPSMGKSSWIVNSVLESAKQGLTSLVFSKEMNAESLVDRMVSIETGLNLHNVRNGIVMPNQVDKVVKAVKGFSDLPIILDSNFMGNIDYVGSVIRKYNHRQKIDLVYVDYAQLLAERGDNSTHELGRIVRNLKLMAEDMGLGIHLASQLNRLVELRDNKRPILSDLRQSGNLEEDSDLVAFLYRDEKYNSNSDFKGKMEYIIRKQRNGATGTVTLNFDENTTKIY